MQDHLTDEQLTEDLLNPEVGGSAGAREHLTTCEACRSEEESLRQLLAHYEQVTRAAAEHPAGFWQRQQTAIAAWMPGRIAPRLAWAAATAMIVLAAVLLIETRPTAAPPAAQTVSETDPDHVLLVEVDLSVRRQMPRALEPAALLTAELSRATVSEPKEHRGVKGESR